MSLIQGFNNLFNRKKAKFGFKLEFIEGSVNHNSITKIQKGECQLNFEDGKIIIKQNNNQIIDSMTDVYNVRTWTFNDEQYFAIRMRTHSEYMFNLKAASLLFRAIENYAQAFNVPIEYCVEPEE